MDIYLGRQPILNRDKKTVAYELLYRSGPENAFPAIDSTAATTKLLHHLFTTLGLKEISHNKKVFINFNKELLTSELPELGYKNVVIEVLEDVVVDPVLIEACKNLNRKGFTLALDDFVMSEEISPLLSLASIIKFDWMATPREQITDICSRLKRYNHVLLAEKIETEDDFNQALDMGFQLFQGYFFSKPKIIQGKALSSAGLSRMQMLQVINNPESEFDEISDIISKDVALVYKLMKIINSAVYNMSKPVSSVQNAVVLLGLAEIRKWFSVLLLSEMSEDSPKELMNLAFSRAMFAEKLAMNNGREDLKNEAFLTGLFSLLDAMLKRPISELVANLPVSESILEALLKQQGDIYPYLALSKAYEKHEVKKIEKILNETGMDSSLVSLCFLDSITETGQLMENE